MVCLLLRRWLRVKKLGLELEFVCSFARLFAKLPQILTQFICVRIRVKTKIRVRVSGNTFKYVFGRSGKCTRSHRTNCEIVFILDCNPSFMQIKRQL